MFGMSVNSMFFFFFLKLDRLMLGYTHRIIKTLANILLSQLDLTLKKVVAGSVHWAYLIREFKQLYVRVSLIRHLMRIGVLTNMSLNAM